MEAYTAAVAGGAQCMELSVGMTSDGFLVCMHDPTYDRTTTAKGQIAAQPSTILRSVRLSAPQLGSGLGAPAPAAGAALRRRAPGIRRSAGAVYRSQERRRVSGGDGGGGGARSQGQRDREDLLQQSAHRCRRKRPGIRSSPISARRATSPPLASTLWPSNWTRQRDYMILPTGASDVLVKQAVATGIPIWIFPVHRRSEAARFLSQGCKGIISSSLRYVSHTEPTAVADTWAYGAIAPGEMTKDPGGAAYAPTWSQNELQLRLQGAQHFLTLGQFGPIAKARQSYTVQFQASLAHSAHVVVGEHDHGVRARGRCLLRTPVRSGQRLSRDSASRRPPATVSAPGRQTRRHPTRGLDTNPGADSRKLDDLPAEGDSDRAYLVANEADTSSQTAGASTGSGEGALRPRGRNPTSPPTSNALNAGAEDKFRDVGIGGFDPVGFRSVGGCQAARTTG